MGIITETKKLRSIVKESVKEVIISEMMKLRSDLLPYISATEQKEIERRYGNPNRKSGRRVSVKA